MITTQPDLQSSTAQRYRCFDVDTFPLGLQQILVRSAKTGDTRVLPAALAGLLFSCNTFKTLLDHSLTVTLDVVQPWGSGTAELAARNYLNDFSKNSASLTGNADVRLTRGLSVTVLGSFLDCQK